MKLDSYLTPYEKNFPKHIKNINIRTTIIKLLEKLIMIIYDLIFLREFQNITGNVEETKENNDKLDYTKIKIF